MAVISRPRPARRRPRRTITFITRIGQSPGLEDIEIPTAQAPGTIRRNIHTHANSILPPPPFSWVDNPPEITVPLRYRATSTFVGIGSSRSINAAPRPIIRRRARVSPITRQVGNKPGTPNVRNRLASFGSRVPPTNQPSPNVEQPSG